MSGQGPISNVDVVEAQRRLGSPDAGGPRPLLVDVRERNEFAEVRVPGSVLLPLSELQTRFRELPSERPLLVMCAAGRRSLVAGMHLASNGYAEVANVEGGITAWQRAGLETRRGAPEPGEGDLPVTDGR